jgi:hypothetical protein
MSYDNIPQILKDQPKRWLPHKDKKPSLVKTSFGVTQTVLVRWSDYGQWLDYQEALSHYLQHPQDLDGLVFLLNTRPNNNGDGLQIACIDLDKTDTQPDYVQVAHRAILDTANTQTYIEVSPSGNGTHVWFMVDPTQTTYQKLTANGIELYPGNDAPQSHHVMTVTGKLYSPTTPTTLTLQPTLPGMVQALQGYVDTHTTTNTTANTNNDYYQRPDTVHEGSRNDELTRYIGNLIKTDAQNDQTLTLNKTIALAHRFNTKHNSPPLDKAEVEQTAKRAWHRWVEKDRREANSGLSDSVQAKTAKLTASTLPTTPSSQLPESNAKPIDSDTLDTLYKITLEDLSKNDALTMFMASIVHVISHGEFYNVVTHVACSLGSLEVSWGAKLGIKNNNSSGARKIWKDSDQRKEADDYGWMPVPYPIEPDKRIYMDGNVRLLNTFRYKCKPIPGNVQPWLDLIAHLIEEPEYALAVLWYFARMIQKPHIKQNWHLVIFGIQGAGKDSLLAPFNNIIPMRTATSNDIRGQYDDHLYQTKLLVLNEAKLNHEMVSEYKRLAATDSVDTRTLNIKGKKKVEQKDVVNVVILSNDPGAVALDKNERRALVLRARRKLPPDKAIAYYEWLEAGGAAHLFDFLLRVDLQAPEYEHILVNETETPYKTQYMMNMADLNKEDYQLDVQDVLDSYPDDIISDTLIFSIIMAANKGKVGDDKYIDSLKKEIKSEMQKDSDWYQWGTVEGGRDRQVQKKGEDKQVLRKNCKPFVKQKALLELSNTEMYEALEELESKHIKPIVRSKF